MVAKLIVEDGPLKGLIFSLEEGDSWVIGRDPQESQLVIEDPLIDLRQLIARRTPEGIVIENLSLTHPVQVNNEDISNHPHLLQQGDTVKMGDTLLRYQADQEPPTEELEITEPAPQEDLIPTTDTILDEKEIELAPLAEIDFGLVETGRWLLKVIGGPNNGAEFYMQAGHSYLIGTDPRSCDIVFHDTSVSRQHARITVTPEDTLLIEDLKSRNGVLVGGVPIENKQPLSPNAIVTLGTTSFVIYDREGEMQTIISPLLPSIVKVLQQEELPKVETPPSTQGEAVSTELPKPEVLEAPPKPRRSMGPLVFFLFIAGLFGIAGLGTMALFKAEPIVVTNTYENANELIQQALRPFPAIHFTFNKSTGGLLLLGHVATQNDKSQLIYTLEGLKFIKNIDDSGVVIDEYVWQEVNSILSKNPAWKGITIHSPKAGEFVLSGYLQSRKQADQLVAYISLNFPYLDLLDRQIVVEEDVINQINTWLQEYNLSEVSPRMSSNGEVSLTGTAPVDKMNEINQLLTKIKQIPGVRIVQNQIRSQAPEMGIKNISDLYEVTGQSRIGDKYTVVINGHILSEKGLLDGMTITKITPNTIFLERDNDKFRIDY